MLAGNSTRTAPCAQMLSGNRSSPLEFEYLDNALYPNASRQQHLDSYAQMLASNRSSPLELEYLDNTLYPNAYRQQHLDGTLCPTSRQ